MGYYSMVILPRNKQDFITICKHLQSISKDYWETWTCSPVGLIPHDIPHLPRGIEINGDDQFMDLHTFLGFRDDPYGLDAFFAFDLTEKPYVYDYRWPNEFGDNPEINIYQEPFERWEADENIPEPYIEGMIE